MVKNVRRNRNYEKTENAIKDALVKLCLDKNSISRITVKDLCETANISKSTFYLHYRDIQGVFESVGEKFFITFDEIMGEIIENKQSDYLIYLEKILDTVADSSELIRVGLTYGEDPGYYVNGIKIRLEKIVVNTVDFTNAKLDKKQIIIETKIVSSGIIDIIIELLRGGDIHKVKETLPQINDFLNRWISTFDDFSKTTKNL